MPEKLKRLKIFLRNGEKLIFTSISEYWKFNDKERVLEIVRTQSKEIQKYIMIPYESIAQVEVE